MFIRQLTCGCIGRVKSVREGRIAQLFSRGLARVRRDLDITNAVKSIRRTKSMSHALLSAKQRLLMSLDKINLLNSEDSEQDPSMSEQVSTSDGEPIDQRIAKGPKWTQILKQEGETYNIVNRRLILAISRKRFTEEDCE